jgi:poly-gamma-glutamate synthesis protein (capsule biosynthesis protein)
MALDRTTLAFVGDVMLGRGIDALSGNRPPETFWGDTLPLLHAADGVVANLECPIALDGRKWARTWKAFRFRASPRAVDLLKAANIRAVNLANNHILDFEWQGVLETLAHLDAAGIAHAGAGRDSRDAAQPVSFKVAGRRIGLIGLTDNVAAFAAGPGEAGTNHIRIRPDHGTLSLIDLQIRGLREAGAEAVILSAHWGPNLRTWPPARFRLSRAAPSSWGSMSSTAIRRICSRASKLMPAGSSFTTPVTFSTIIGSFPACAPTDR